MSPGTSITTNQRKCESGYRPVQVVLGYMHALMLAQARCVGTHHCALGECKPPRRIGFQAEAILVTDEADPIRGEVVLAEIFVRIQRGEVRHQPEQVADESPGTVDYQEHDSDYVETTPKDGRVDGVDAAGDAEPDARQP